MRVLVLDRSRATCEAIAAGLAGEEAVEATEIAFSPTEALGLLARPGLAVDVVVTTMSPGEAAILALARELRDRPEAPDLVVAGLPASESVIVRYLQAGVSAYLTEEISIQGLGLTLSLLARGEALVPPAVAHRLIRRLQTQASILNRSGVDVSRLARLTPREREVLAQIAEGASNRRIAQRLFIEVGTVKSHVHAILKKLGVSGREEARRLLILHRSARPPQPAAEPEPSTGSTS